MNWAEFKGHFSRPDSEVSLSVLLSLLIRIDTALRVLNGVLLRTRNERDVEIAFGRLMRSLARLQRALETVSGYERSPLLLDVKRSVKMAIDQSSNRSVVVGSARSVSAVIELYYTHNVSSIWFEKALKMGNE